MKLWIVAAAGAVALAGANATAVEPARESQAERCAEAAQALNLQGEDRRRYIAACAAAKENAQPPADEDPVLAAARRAC
jgi:hypothetical protein